MVITPLDKWIAEKIGCSGSPDAAALAAYQLERLRETVAYAHARSRFYQAALSDIFPDAITCLDDIQKLPFTYPSDIARAPHDFLCVSPRDIHRIVTLSTSGTTGSPKRLFFTEEDQELTADFFHHGMQTLTGPGDRVMIFMPGATPGSVGDLLIKGLARFGCTGIAYGPIKDYQDAGRALVDEGITAVVGIPSQVLTLARSTPAAGTHVHSVLLSADYVPQAACDAIEQAWGARVFTHYGMTETGLGGGVDCEDRNGYHLREADLYFEMIDPISGLPVPDGEYGEVVFTTLTRRGMPLIRYRTGDRARFLTQRCPCGSVLRRMDHVTGRIAETVLLSEGRTLSVTALDDIVLADDDVLSYSAMLDMFSGQERLCLSIRPVSTGDDWSDGARMVQRLDRALRAQLLPQSLRLDIHIGDTDFFTTGTLKRTIADHRAISTGLSS